MNVGASAAEDPGLYFSWGNSPGHAEGSGYNFSQEVYFDTPGVSIQTDLTIDEDMARLSSGFPWRLPTKEEFQELFDNCTSMWTTINGIAGRLFISNANGNSIFFPAAGDYDGVTLNNRGSFGYYWSSSYYSATSAYNLLFHGSVVNPQGSSQRRYGFVVRAVFKP